MKILAQTLSILTGSTICNARCPFCVSKMTPHGGVDLALPDVNWRNFETSCHFAKDSGVSTVLLTGKGEPTLFPGMIEEFLSWLNVFSFPFIEMQTNGISIYQRRYKNKNSLERWYKLGLTTVAVSIVHYEDKANKENYQPHGRYMDLAKLIEYLHSFGFSVRLSCIMFRGGIDSEQELAKLIQFAKENKAEQLTITPVRAPQKSDDSKVKRWVKDHELDFDTQAHIKSFLNVKGRKLLPLAHNAMVYDIGGQNVCLSDCLTENKSAEEIRQLIFFPDGHLRYDWQYLGAILL